MQVGWGHLRDITIGRCLRLDIAPFDPSATRTYLYTRIAQVNEAAVLRPSMETSIVTLLAAIQESSELLDDNDTAQPLKVSLFFL